MSNRFLKLFLVLFLSLGFNSLLLIQCSTPVIEEKDDMTDEERDLKKFNEIADEFRKKLFIEVSQRISSDYEVTKIQNTQLQATLDKGSSLTDDKISEGLKSDDRAVNFFQGKFEDAFKKVSAEIISHNSNIYAKGTR